MTLNEYHEAERKFQEAPEHTLFKELMNRSWNDGDDDKPELQALMRAEIQKYEAIIREMAAFLPAATT